MLDALVRFSLNNRYVVVIFAVILCTIGVHVVRQIPIDALPDLTAPTVTLMVDIHGLAPEEIETLITRPIEGVVNGAPGVRRVRSNSTFGLSTIWVEFYDGTDIYLARQIVNEKLQLVLPTLPSGAVPTMGAITSIMGEIMTIGLRSSYHTPMFLKELADFTIRNRLLSVAGVAQVVIVGGETKQYRINLDQNKMLALSVSLSEVIEAARNMNENFSAGVMKSGNQDYLIRGIGRVRSIEDIGNSVIVTRQGTPILIRDVASISISPAFRIGETSVNASPAILLSVLKHPQGNTMDITRRVDAAMAELQDTLPKGVVIDTHVFRQSTFIQRAIDNVYQSLGEAIGLVILVLILFLGNVRTSIISLSAIPLTLVITAFVFRMLDMNLNTMTLGGIAIAIGLIVDDAIIDVENVFRRLHQEAEKPSAEQCSLFEIVRKAMTEIRSSVINANMIGIAVFLPLFFLSGVEGKLLRPLGIAYVISTAGSLLVSLFVTPALCAILLGSVTGGTGRSKNRESLLFRILKRMYQPFLQFSLRFPWIIILSGALAVGATVIPFSRLGRSFLPVFNEGSLVIKVSSPPGTSLEKAAETATIVEHLLLKHPNVLRTSRKTGRGENDEHGKFSSESEVEAILDLQEHSFADVLADLRQRLAVVPGAMISFSQPLSHRIDHMLSGAMANIAIKTFGPELFRLRALNEKIYRAIRDVPGLVDLGVEQQVDISQIRIKPRRHKLAKFGLTIVDVAHAAELAFGGLKVSSLLEGEKEFAIVLKFPEERRESIEKIAGILIDTPLGVKVPLSTLAEVVSAKGPYMINRENTQRRILVQANVAGRDLRGVYEDVKARIEARVPLPQGYSIIYGGQFESKAEATRMVSLLSIVSVLFILLCLFIEFGSYRDSLIVLVNLPLALIGGVLAVFFTTGIVDISSLVGFITLFGVATRNGILLVSRYRHLMMIEGRSLQEAVFQGSSERLRPILMIALCSFFGFLPFAIAGDQPGNEILAPLAVVASGGLISSTLLNMFLLPALYVTFGRQKVLTPPNDPSSGAPVA